SGITKVFDFSIASAIPIATASTSTELTVFDAHALGALTPAYASLERWNGLVPEPRDDIFAFALVAYELLTGEHPYGRKTAPEALATRHAVQPVPGLNRRQWRALNRGLALQRADRSATIGELLAGLQPRPWYRLGL